MRTFTLALRPALIGAAAFSAVAAAAHLSNGERASLPRPQKPARSDDDALYVPADFVISEAEGRALIRYLSESPMGL